MVCTGRTAAELIFLFSYKIINERVKKIKIPRKDSHNVLKVLNTLCSRVRYFNIGWLSVAKALKIKYIPHLGFVVESYLSKNKAL